MNISQTGVNCGVFSYRIGALVSITAAGQCVGLNQNKLQCSCSLVILMKE